MSTDTTVDSSPSPPPARAARELGKQPLMWLLCLCYGLCMIFVIGIFLTIVLRLDMANLGAQTFAVRLMQTTLGMLIGVTFAILGVVAVWLGLIEATNIEVSGWGKAAAAGPGGLLVSCGTLIICMCLVREFHITERSGEATGLENIQQSATSDGANG